MGTSSIRGVRRIRSNGLKLNFGSTSLRKNKSGPTTPCCKPVDGHKANFHDTPIQKAVDTDRDHNSALGTSFTFENWRSRDRRGPLKKTAPKMLSSKPLPLTPGKSTKASIALVSGREFEVFQLIGRGKSTAQIAKELHLSTKAVEAHREHVDRVRSQLVRDKGYAAARKKPGRRWPSEISQRASGVISSSRKNWEATKDEAPPRPNETPNLNSVAIDETSGAMNNLGPVLLLCRSCAVTCHPARDSRTLHPIWRNRSPLHQAPNRLIQIVNVWTNKYSPYDVCRKSYSNSLSRLGVLASTEPG
jgi:hypothetical protein